VPAKNRVKQYKEQGYYHIYNRGVEKRNIFTDEQDKSVFLGYLKEYLTVKENDKLIDLINNPESNNVSKDKARKLLRMNNISDQIHLLSFCLMPNHFHLLIKQEKQRSIELFMKSLFTRYVQYFNHKHGRRVGPLFQGAYKAVLIISNEQLIHTSRYIHLNPLANTRQGLSLRDKPGCSSYLNYLGIVTQNWVKPNEILSSFSKSKENSYEAFVEDSRNNEVTYKLILQGLSL
jgi:putative transposase